MNIGSLGFTPEFISWIEAVKRGDKILWHEGMYSLQCFSPDFEVEAFPNYIASPLTPDHFHDLLYSMYEDTKRLVGVQFWCFHGMLEQTDILASRDEEGNLSPLEVFSQGVRWYEDREAYLTYTAERRERMRTDNTLATEFFKNYPLKISASIWMKAIPTRRQ